MKASKKDDKRQDKAVLDDSLSIDDEVGQVEDSQGIEKMRKDFGKLKMKKLRVIGHTYGVADTKKSELIDEIINEKIKRGEI